MKRAHSHVEGALFFILVIFLKRNDSPAAFSASVGPTSTLSWPGATYSQSLQGQRQRKDVTRRGFTSGLFVECLLSVMTRVFSPVDQRLQHLDGLI